jgi:hypothetical protein
MRIYRIRISLEVAGSGYLLEVCPTGLGGRRISRTWVGDRDELRSQLREIMDMSNIEFNYVTQIVRHTPYYERKIALAEDTVRTKWGRLFDSTVSMYCILDWTLRRFGTPYRPTVYRRS